jgi:hypothetical protein
MQDYHPAHTHEMAGTISPWKTLCLSRLGQSRKKDDLRRSLTTTVCSFICADSFYLEVVMVLRMTVTDVEQVESGIVRFEMPPHQIRHFGTTSHTCGAQSVLIFDAWDYDESNRQLSFDVSAVHPVNVGKGPSVIGLVSSPVESRSARTDTDWEQMLFAPGDREFLRLASSELSAEMAQVAKSLLLAVRKKSPGNLKRGQARNFSDTPDNFWYVIVQPRVDELSITVRGSVEYFSSIAKLEIKDDRGNARFKVRGARDIPAAMELILGAIRKG